MSNMAYEDLLFDIQQDFENHSPIVEIVLTPDEQIFDIDLNSRTIEVPQLLSVRYDHNAEVVYFKCPRYFDNMDLTTTVCIIEYINANGVPGIYWVPYYDISKYESYTENSFKIETPAILIPWLVDGLVTEASGEVTFAVRFYKLANDKTFMYNMSTQPAKAEVLHGMDVTDDFLGYIDNNPNIVEYIYADLAKVKNEATTYWVDLM